MRRWPAGGDWICPPGGVSAFRQGQTVSVPRGTSSPGTVRIYAAGLGFLGLGEIEAGGPAGAAAAYFGGQRIELEGGCRDAYNARLPKGSKLLIEV